MIRYMRRQQRKSLPNNSGLQVVVEAVDINSRTDLTVNKVKGKGMMHVGPVITRAKGVDSNPQGTIKDREVIKIKETVLTTEGLEVARMDKTSIKTKIRTKDEGDQTDSNLNNNNIKIRINNNNNNNNSSINNSHSRDSKEDMTSNHSNSNSHPLPHTHLRLPLYLMMKYQRELP